MRAILVLTGGDLVNGSEERARAAAMLQKTMNEAARRTLPLAKVEMPSGVVTNADGLDDLHRHLLDALPIAGLLLQREKVRNREEERFQKVRRRVLFYAGLAGSTDVAPLIGAVSVPTTQLAMLRELGAHYGIEWDHKTAAAFLGAMGAGIGARFAASYGLRQLAKLIPVYGQTVGAVASGSVSFATTFALGRAAAYFLHWQSEGRGVDEDSLREVYSRAFKVSSDAPD